jgi:hypothetical protein
MNKWYKTNEYNFNFNPGNTNPVKHCIQYFTRVVRMAVINMLRQCFYMRGVGFSGGYYSSALPAGIRCCCACTKDRN